MAVSGSLQLSHDVGICRNRRCDKQFKSVTGRGKLHLLTISSHAMRQDSWSIYLSDSLHRPIHAVPCRQNVCKFHRFLTPRQGFHAPSRKIDAKALMRSYNALHGSPVTLKLVPAVGIIIFAVWGIGPLMCKSRNLFLHKSDNSWRKSSTYYVMTSYLQPLLLWTGATLICRVLDPLVLPTEASQIVKQRLLNFIRSLSTVLAFAYCLSSVIQQAQKFFIERSDSTDTRNMGFQFAGKAVYTAVWVAAVSLFMELLGFSTQKWLTAGGLGTVLLTLAGREIFTNFLSSAMIHATRPFVVNEWIQTKIEGYEVSGTVEHVGWWSPTIVRGEDREAVHIPNHKFTVNVVRNLSQKTHWRIKTHLAISHLDVNKINNIVADMRKVLAKNPQVEQQRLHRRVFLENVNSENQALLILISCFVKTSHFEEYLCVKEAILLDLLRVISHHRARLATPIRTVQKIYSDADLENLPFSDAIFTRGGGAGASSNRPMLLIEPTYRINGEERPKTRSVQESKATKAGSSTPSDSKVKDTPTSEAILTSEAQNFDTKTESKAAVVDKVNIKSTSKAVPKIDSNPKIAVSASDQNISDSKQLKKAVSSSGNEKKQEGAQPQASKNALEENIVLGVALEGSKRTLPIEDGMGPSHIPADGKELAACRNGNGNGNGSGSRTPAGEKEKKDGQGQAGDQ